MKKVLGFEGWERRAGREVQGNNCGYKDICRLLGWTPSLKSPTLFNSIRNF